LPLRAVNTIALQAMRPVLTPPILVLCATLLAAPAATGQDSASLKARHGELEAALADNPFRRPIVLTSSEQGDRIAGDVHARIAQPFRVVGAALQGIEQWCQILILHPNVKQCRRAQAPTPTLDMVVGSKHDQPIEAAHRMQFAYEVVASRADYLQVALHAAQGPMSTRDYRIVLEAVPLDAKRSFLHLSYAYGYGSMARLAMQGYLATAGRNKVGFSVVGRREDGSPRYVGGTRGVIERNTMRYYLAIEAYLATLSLPAPVRLEQRLATWYGAIEDYPLQLSDLERADYLELKRSQTRPGQAPGG
jgi:hypothetical protein